MKVSKENDFGEDVPDDTTSWVTDEEADAEEDSSQEAKTDNRDRYLRVGSVFETQTLVYRASFPHNVRTAESLLQTKL